jgi:hypothetical protein
LRQVEKLYFEILARDDVFPLPAQPTPVDLGQAGAAGLPEKAKQQGRYRLTDNEIEKRKRTVKQAQELMKESDYTKTWEQIADDLGMSDRTLRDWRHNPIYS